MAVGRTAANLQQRRAAAAGLDRQTDGRTDARQLHRPCSAYCAASANNINLIIGVHYSYVLTSGILVTANCT